MALATDEKPQCGSTPRGSMRKVVTVARTLKKSCQAAALALARAPALALTAGVTWFT